MQNRNEDHDWQRHAPEVGRAVLRSFGVLHDMNVDFQHGDIFEEDIGTQAEYCYRIEKNIIIVLIAIHHPSTTMNQSASL
jgi:hypothetical protein